MDASSGKKPLFWVTISTAACNCWSASSIPRRSIQTMEGRRKLGKQPSWCRASSSGSACAAKSVKAAARVPSWATLVSPRNLRVRWRFSAAVHRTTAPAPPSRRFVPAQPDAPQGVAESAEEAQSLQRCASRLVCPFNLSAPAFLCAFAVAFQTTSKKCGADRCDGRRNRAGKSASV